ncbi:MAG: glutathione S-transferase family protein [Gammaproteobacteria bacterium]|nr:MAG: glutathione S-transferase family protein [Gammaproteobacteria bacterium]
MLKLYHMWTSTCSKKVRLALAEKNLEWESRAMSTNPAPETLEPWYLKINPNAVVPSLDHDGRIIIESCVILEYLDDVFPDPPLRPADHVDRATMRVWLDRSESVVHRNINILSHNRFMATALGGMTLEQKLAMANRHPKVGMRTERLRRYREGVSAEEEQLAESLLAELMDEMEATLGTQSWLAGAGFSLADIAITPFIERFKVNRLAALIDWSKRPAVGDWWRRITARPSYEKGMALHMAAAPARC